MNNRRGRDFFNKSPDNKFAGAFPRGYNTELLRGLALEAQTLNPVVVLDRLELAQPVQPAANLAANNAQQGVEDLALQLPVPDTDSDTESESSSQASSDSDMEENPSNLGVPDKLAQITNIHLIHSLTHLPDSVIMKGLEMNKNLQHFDCF